VPDDLRGWFETKNGERVRQPGVLDSFQLTPEQAEQIIMEARVAAGWIDPPEPVEDVADDGPADIFEEAEAVFSDEGRT
jgi:N utilization substance protein A